MVTAAAHKKPNLKIPIILMAWPAGALVVAFILYIVFNLLFSLGGSPVMDEPFSVDPARAIVNVVLFIISVASILGGPASFAVGLALLITRTVKARELEAAGKPAIVKPSSGTATVTVVHATSGLAIAGMVLGIVGLLTSWLGIGIIVGIVGICLSAISLKHPHGKGMAIAGLVTSIIAVILGLIIVSFFVIAAVVGVQGQAHQDYLQSSSDGSRGGI